MVNVVLVFKIYITPCGNSPQKSGCNTVAASGILPLATLVRPGNCSYVALPSAIPGGRMHGARCGVTIVLKLL